MVVASVPRAGWLPASSIISEHHGADIQHSGSVITGWPSVVGPALGAFTTAPIPMPSYDGAGLDGNPGAVFTRATFTGLEYATPLSSTADDWTFTTVIAPTDQGGLGGANRGYLGNVRNDYPANSAGRLIMAHVANVPQWRNLGFFNGIPNGDPPGNGWHLFYVNSYKGTPVSAVTSGRPQILTYALGSDSVVARDGTSLGSSAQYQRKALGVQCTFGAPVNADGLATDDHFDGKVFYIQWRRGRAPNTQILAMHAALMAQFPSIIKWPPTPAPAFLSEFYWLDTSRPEFWERDVDQIVSAAGNAANTALYEATQGNASLRGWLYQDSVNSRPAIEFTGSRQMALNTLAAAVSGNGPTSMVVITKTHADSTSVFPINISHSVTAAQFRVNARSGSGNTFFGSRHDGTGLAQAVGADGDLNPHLHLLEYDGVNTVRYQLDGNAPVTATRTFLSAVFDLATIGLNSQRIAQIAILPRTLTAQNRTDARAWSQSWYNTP